MRIESDSVVNGLLLTVEFTILWDNNLLNTVILVSL